MPFPAILIEAILLGVEDAACASAGPKPHVTTAASASAAASAPSSHGATVRSLLRPQRTAIRSDDETRSRRRKRAASSTPSAPSNDGGVLEDLEWHSLFTTLSRHRSPTEGSHHNDNDVNFHFAGPFEAIVVATSDGRDPPSRKTLEGKRPLTRVAQPTPQAPQDVFVGSSQVAIFDRKTKRKQVKRMNQRQAREASLVALADPDVLGGTDAQMASACWTVGRTNSFFLFKRDIDRYVRSIYQDRPMLLEHWHATVAIPKIAGVIWRHLPPHIKAIYTQEAARQRPASS